VPTRPYGKVLDISNKLDDFNICNKTDMFLVQKYVWIMWKVSFFFLGEKNLTMEVIGGISFIEENRLPTHENVS